MVTVTNSLCMINECISLEEKKNTFEFHSTLHRVDNQSNFLTKDFSP